MRVASGSQGGSGYIHTLKSTKESFRGGSQRVFNGRFVANTRTSLQQIGQDRIAVTSVLKRGIRRCDTLMVKGGSSVGHIFVLCRER
eukprot:scaffold3281_cov286-Prasinococcus_capsulatus_cf.AAC.10